MHLRQYRTTLSAELEDSFLVGERVLAPSKNGSGTDTDRSGLNASRVHDTSS